MGRLAWWLAALVVLTPLVSANVLQSLSPLREPGTYDEPYLNGTLRFRVADETTVHAKILPHVNNPVNDGSTVLQDPTDGLQPWAVTFQLRDGSGAALGEPTYRRSSAPTPSFELARGTYFLDVAVRVPERYEAATTDRVIVAIVAETGSSSGNGAVLDESRGYTLTFPGAVGGSPTPGLPNPNDPRSNDPIVVGWWIFGPLAGLLVIAATLVSGYMVGRERGALAREGTQPDPRSRKRVRVAVRTESVWFRPAKK